MTTGSLRRGRMKTSNGIGNGWIGCALAWRANIIACIRVCVICALWGGLASTASAQTLIVIGPTSTIQWDMGATVPTTAQGFTYGLSVDGGSPLVLAGVTCATVTQTTCKTLASILPLGSHSLTLTASSGGVTTLPSAPFAYLTIVIPVPQGLRLVP